MSSAAGAADNYPARPIRLMVPYGAGTLNFTRMVGAAVDYSLTSQARKSRDSIATKQTEAKHVLDSVNADVRKLVQEQQQAQQ